MPTKGRIVKAAVQVGRPEAAVPVADGAAVFTAEEHGFFPLAHTPVGLKASQLAAARSADAAQAAKEEKPSGDEPKAE